MKKMKTNLFSNHHKISEKESWLQRCKWPNGIIKIIIKLNQVIPSLLSSVSPSRIILAFEGWGMEKSLFRILQCKGVLQTFKAWEKSKKKSIPGQMRLTLHHSVVSSTLLPMAVELRKLTLHSSSSISSSPTFLGQW